MCVLLWCDFYVTYIIVLCEKDDINVLFKYLLQEDLLNID